MAGTMPGEGGRLSGSSPQPVNVASRAITSSMIPAGAPAGRLDKTGAGVHRLHLVDQYGSADRTVVRQRHFPWPEFPVGGDGANQDAVRNLVVVSGRKDKRRTPASLLVAGMRAEVEPDEIAALEPRTHLENLKSDRCIVEGFRRLPTARLPDEFGKAVAWRRPADDHGSSFDADFDVPAFLQAEAFDGRSRYTYRQGAAPIAEAGPGDKTFSHGVHIKIISYEKDRVYRTPSTNESSTRFWPARSKSMVSLLPSIETMLPLPNFR